MPGRSTPPYERGDLAQDLDYETADPANRPQNPSFVLQMIMELKGSHGSLTNAVDTLNRSIESHGKRLETMSEFRADIREIMTKLTAIEKEQGDSKTKLEKVHTWVIGATAVLAVIVIVAQIGLRFWPSQPQPIVVHVDSPAAGTPAVQPPKR